jgi:hypothetical protein
MRERKRQDALKEREEAAPKLLKRLRSGKQHCKLIAILIFVRVVRIQTITQGPVFTLCKPTAISAQKRLTPCKRVSLR